MLKSLLWVVFLFFALTQTMKYGGIWDSQHNPTKNVTVVLKSGEVVSGDLSRTWRGDFRLAEPTGETMDFADYSVMSFEAPVEPGGMVAHWRAYILPMLVLLSLIFRETYIFVSKKEKV